MSAAPERPDLENIQRRLGFPPKEPHMISGGWRQVVLDLIAYALALEGQRDAAREVVTAARRLMANCENNGRAGRWLVSAGKGLAWSDAALRLDAALARLEGKS